MKINKMIRVSLLFILSLVLNCTMSSADIEVLVPNFTDLGYDLPIIVIDTLGNRIGETELQKSKMYIINNENRLNYLDHPATYSSDIGIKIRGKSSKSYPKKQYKVELWNEEGAQVSHSLLTMPKQSDWVLDGPFKDKSLMRNQLVFSIARKMMVYAPRTRYCEVFVIDDGSVDIKDKHFKGLYLLKESIKKDEQRVNIFPSYDDLVETSFLATKDVPKDTDITVNTYGKDTIIYPRKIKLNYPKKMVSEEKLKYISRTISEFERVLYSSNYNSDGKGYEEHIIIESFVDYYIINEFFRNTDAGIYSTYFSKDYGEKIRLGPVWDFNESMGNDLDSGDYFEHTGFHISGNFWLDRLMTDRKFVSKVISRYRVLRKTFISDEYLLEEIDILNFRITNARKRNFRKWPFELCAQVEIFEQTWLGLLGRDQLVVDMEDLSEKIILLHSEYRQYQSDSSVLLELVGRYDHLNDPESNIATDYEDEITKLKEFIVNRGKWMDDNIDYLLRFTY